MNQMFSRVIPEPAAVPAGVEDQAAGGLPAMRDLVEVLYRRKAWVIVTTAACLAVGLLYGLTRERQYVATAQMLIDPRGIQVVDRDVTPRNETTDGSIAVVESQLRVMTSKRVLEEVIERENLLADPEFNGSEPSLIGAAVSAIGGLFGSSGPQTDPKLVVLDALSDAVAAGRPERTYVIDLSVRTRDPEKSARIANAITEVYLETGFAVRAGLARRASDSLASRLDELRADLRAAEDRVVRYRVENNIVDTGGGLVNEQQLQEWNTQLVEARARTSAAQAKLEQVRRLQSAGTLPENLPEAVLSDTIRELRVQYTAAKQREVALSARLLPGHPTMQQVSAQVRSVRAEIDAELARIAEAAELDFNRARANQADLEEKLGGLKQTAFATNDALVQLRELERNAEASRLVYEAFLVRTRELSEQEQVDTADARVISAAMPPVAPAGPGTPLILALAMACGAGLGTLLALGRETVDPAIRSGRQLAQRTGLGVLATVPIRDEDGAGSLPAFAARHPGSPASMALQAVVTTLHRLRGYGEPRTVLVTAPAGNTGKTTVSLNLALAAAARGDRVLLIDGDLAKASLSAARLDRPARGLADVLRGELPLGEAIVDDPSRLVRVLPAGRRAGQFLAGEASPPRLADALFGSLEGFDTVVVDGAAATHEGCLAGFADVADAVVMVVRAGVTNERQVARAMRALGPNWSKTAGAILITETD